MARNLDITQGLTTCYGLDVDEALAFYRSEARDGGTLGAAPPSRARRQASSSAVWEVYTGTPKQSTWQAYFFNEDEGGGAGRDDDLAPQELWYARWRLAQRKILGELDHRRMPTCVRALARELGGLVPGLAAEYFLGWAQMTEMLSAGDEIPPHTDATSYGDVIATVQLAGDARVTLTPSPPREGGCSLRGHAVFELAAGDACVALLSPSLDGARAPPPPPLTAPLASRAVATCCATRRARSRGTASSTRRRPTTTATRGASR